MSPVCFEKQVPSTLTGQTWTWPHLAVKPAFLQHRTLIDKWTTCRLSVRVEFYDRLGLTRKVVALAIRPSKRETPDFLGSDHLRFRLHPCGLLQGHRGLCRVRASGAGVSYPNR